MTEAGVKTVYWETYFPNYVANNQNDVHSDKPRFSVRELWLAFVKGYSEYSGFKVNSRFATAMKREYAWFADYMKEYDRIHGISDRRWE